MNSIKESLLKCLCARKNIKLLEKFYWTNKAFLLCSSLWIDWVIIRPNPFRRSWDMEWSFWSYLYRPLKKCHSAWKHWCGRTQNIIPRSSSMSRAQLLNRITAGNLQIIPAEFISSVYYTLEVPVILHQYKNSSLWVTSISSASTEGALSWIISPVFVECVEFYDFFLIIQRTCTCQWRLKKRSRERFSKINAFRFSSPLPRLLSLPFFFRTSKVIHRRNTQLWTVENGKWI